MTFQFLVQDLFGETFDGHTNDKIRASEFVLHYDGEHVDFY